MIVVFDLDYTLLDTERFKEALAEAFAACGIGRAEFDRTYGMTVSARPPEYDYDIDRHISLAAKSLTCGAGELKRSVTEMLRTAGRYLYPGAREMLKSLRSREARLVLLTLGNESWQRSKVEQSGISELFDEIVTVGAGKENAVGGIAQGHEKVFVVNDNVDEMVKMRGSHPSFVYIVKRGPKGLPEDLDMPVCDSFDEIEDIINSAS